MIITLLATLVSAILLFSLLDNTSFVASKSKAMSRPKTIKEYTRQYFDDFQMYLCIPNKVLLFPPRELLVRGVPYALNTQTKSDILPFKRMIMKKTAISRTRRCTECIRQCSISSSHFVNIGLNFNQFRMMTNEELLNHLRNTLTQEQFTSLFGSKFPY